MLHQFQLMATAKVGDGKENLYFDSLFKESPYWRRIKRIAICGSVATASLTVDVYYQNRKVLENLCLSRAGAGVAPLGNDMILLSGGEMCPPGVEIRIVATGTATTNPVYCCIEFDEMPSIRRR